MWGWVAALIPLKYFIWHSHLALLENEPTSSLRENMGHRPDGPAPGYHRRDGRKMDGMDTALKSPRLPVDHPDQCIECQEEIEHRVVDLVAEAVAAGWDLDCVTAAIVEVADNLRLQAHANAETERQIMDSNEVQREDEH